MVFLIGGWNAVAASAGLVGDVVSLSMQPSFWVPNPSHPTVVDPGAESTLGDPSFLGNVFTLDIRDSEIWMILNGPPSFHAGEQNALTISDLDWNEGPRSIAGIDLEIVGNIVGLQATDITHGDDNLRIDFADTDWSAGARAILHLQTVPEPNALVIAAMGLFVLHGRKRKARLGSYFLLARRSRNQ